jgi:mRNA interferase MazF
MAVTREKVGDSFVRLDVDVMLEVECCLAVFLGIAK